MIQFTTKIIETGADSWRTSTTLCFIKPEAFRDALTVLLEQAASKTAGYLNIRLDLPHRPRSTGHRSQNNRFYGHCEDLAEQVLDENGKPQYSKQQIHDAMLRMAVSEGYPTYLDLNGVEMPLPDSQASMEQLSVAQRVLQRYADVHGFWLHEYVAEGPRKGQVYKSIGGRSIEEMTPELLIQSRRHRQSKSVTGSPPIWTCG